MDSFDFSDMLFGKKSESDANQHDQDQPVNKYKRALIVEDDELTRRLIQRLLEREFEMKVKTLANGLEGLEYMQDHHPPLLILDLMLPGMNGFEVLKELREDEMLEDSKVILVSAKSRSEDIERGFDLTADEYITKPFQPKEFIARVRKLLQED